MWVLLLTLFPHVLSLHNPYVLVVKMYRMSCLGVCVCVCAFLTMWACVSVSAMVLSPVRSVWPDSSRWCSLQPFYTQLHNMLYENSYLCYMCTISILDDTWCNLELQPPMIMISLSNRLVLSNALKIWFKIWAGWYFLHLKGVYGIVMLHSMRKYKWHCWFECLW